MTKPLKRKMTKKMKMENNPEVIGCDLYNQALTGDVASSLTAGMFKGCRHSGPSLMIVDSPDDVLGVDCYNLCSTGNIGRTSATNSGGLNEHIPVVCFEPGIMSRDCSAGNRAYMDICSTLRAQMGDNQPAVCYAEEDVYTMNERQISMMVQKNKANTIAATDYKGVQILCYEEDNE